MRKQTRWIATVKFVALSTVLTAQAAKAAPTYRPGGSQEVLYSFPTEAEQLSVGRNGELTFGLKIPTFPAYLQPQLVAHYDSQGGDGPMGIGWTIAVPNVALDFSDTTEALTNTLDEIDLEEGKYITDRFIANPGGKLVCETDGSITTASTWTEDVTGCFTNPRTPGAQQ